MLSLGVSLQPRWPIDDETAALRAASHAEDLDFDHVAVGNRLLDSGFGLDADPLVLLSRSTTRSGYRPGARRAHRRPPRGRQGPVGAAAHRFRRALHDAARRTPWGTPVTPGGPPVWVGGHSDAALIRALRFGDGWYGTGVTAAAGLTACTAWLPIAAEHVEKAMDWIAAEVIPHLT